MRDDRAATFARILTLKRAGFLRGLPTQQLTAVAELAVERFVPQGRHLLREGEPVPAVYVLVDGQAHVTRKGRHMSLRGPGETIGSLCFLAKDAHGVAAVAATDVVAYELDGDALLEVFEEHFPILHHALREMARMCLELMSSAPLPLVAPFLPVLETPSVSREPDLVERILVLRRAGVFTHASINALAELSQGMAHVSYPAEIKLWDPGEPSGSLLLILGGSARLTMAGGAEFVAGPGFPLGAMESLAERPRWYAAETLTRLEALHGTTEGLIDIIEDNPEMALSYLAVICGLILSIRESLAPPEAHDAAGNADEVGA
jgi:CRP-like cAMP-binding protein